RGDKDGRYTLRVSWFTSTKLVELSAPDYSTVTNILGPRALRERNPSRDFQMQRTVPPARGPQVPTVVVETFPTSGATEVDPALTELRVIFSKPVSGGGWSWTAWSEENF